MYQQQPYQTGMNMPTQYDPYQYGGAGYGSQPKVRFPSKNEIISTVARMISPYVEPVVVLIDEEVRTLPHICKVPPLEWKLERITIPYSFDGQTVWNITCYTHHASAPNFGGATCNFIAIVDETIPTGKDMQGIAFMGEY